MSIVKKYCVLFFILICVFHVHTCKSQTSNFDIADSLANESAAMIITQLKTHNIRLVHAQYGSHPSAWFIEKKIMTDTSFSFFGSKMKPEVSILKLNLSAFKSTYTRDTNDTDLLHRLIELEISGTITLPDGSITVMQSAHHLYQDSIKDDLLAQIETSPYPFSKGKVPPKPSSLWENIFEPIVIIGSSALAVVLFFTVRSK